MQTFFLFSPLLFMVPPSVHTRIHTQTHTHTQSNTQSHVYTHAQKFSMSEPWTQVCAHLKKGMSYSIISVFLFWYSVLSIGTVKTHDAFVVKVSLSAHMLMRTSCTMHIKDRSWTISGETFGSSKDSGCRKMNSSAASPCRRQASTCKHQREINTQGLQTSTHARTRTHTNTNTHTHSLNAHTHVHRTMHINMHSTNRAGRV